MNIDSPRSQPLISTIQVNVSADNAQTQTQANTQAIADRAMITRARPLTLQRRNAKRLKSRQELEAVLTEHLSNTPLRNYKN